MRKVFLIIRKIFSYNINKISKVSFRNGNIPAFIHRIFQPQWPCHRIKCFFQFIFAEKPVYISALRSLFMLILILNCLWSSLTTSESGCESKVYTPSSHVTGLGFSSDPSSNASESAFNVTLSPGRRIDSFPSTL